MKQYEFKNITNKIMTKLLENLTSFVPYIVS
jgi:hypothetical protein